MWKPKPEDNHPMSTNQPSATSTLAPNATASLSASPKETQKPSTVAPDRADVGHIGKSVIIHGELTGNEDLYLDGEVEGTIDLRDHKLVIGPNGRIKATISARDVAVHGRVEGNVSAIERVELKKGCTLIGDVSTQRIVIEDGAFFKGSIDIKEGRDSRSEMRKPIAAAASPGTGMGMSSGTSYSASSGPQGSFLEPK